MFGRICLSLGSYTVFLMVRWGYGFLGGRPSKHSDIFIMLYQDQMPLTRLTLDRVHLVGQQKPCLSGFSAAVTFDLIPTMYFSETSH